MDDLDREGSGEVGFKRHLLAPGLLVFLAEVLLVVFPLYTLFGLGELETALLLRVAIPVLAGMSLVWVALHFAMLAPVQRAIQLRRRGKRLPRAIAARAYRATLQVPMRLLLVRTGLWVLSAALVAAFLVRYMDWPWSRVFEMSSLAAMHGFTVNLLRAVWAAGVLAAVRGHLFAGRAPLERFADGYFGRFVLIATLVSGGTLAAISPFLYYMIPISLEQYLQLQTYFPPAVFVGTAAWVMLARRSTRMLDRYLRGQLSEERPAPDEGPATTSVYRRAQSLPYRLSLYGLAIWLLVTAVGAALARVHLRFELDDTVLMVGIALLTGVGASIYASLFHRETMWPLLSHMSVHHRLPVHKVQPSLSLRSKLLMSFGGVVLLACGMALFWSFVQYKNLVNDFVSRQADLSLAWLRSEINATAANRQEQPTPAMVRHVLDSAGERNPKTSAVFYYLSPDPGDDLYKSGVGEGPNGLPWYAVAKMTLPGDGELELGASMEMSGRHGRLIVPWHGQRIDLGGVAVLYPDYRGQGGSTVRTLNELLIFFLVLFAACAGIVTLTVAQFVKPIRKLEQRADGMARGELAEPVSSGAEGDEIGRLTFALESMRRALRDKLRSTEEVNLDLERAVQRRTADLAKKNRELAETLDKLTRTQDQLVRSEKMASIGQLVAGIAHEINNPVNAIVNTVGPLEEAIEYLESENPDERQEARADVLDMIRVVNRGAQRTKAIVQALHNYSRTDDERVVDFDLNLGLDDSLELLRHLLKQHINVERDYGSVGRIRGHAGQLNQVFMNLLTNAAQALAGVEGATIRIQTRGLDDAVVIRISDNGPGIPPEVLPRIWDPFFTTKDVGEGTGLGLSIVHELVERHGGSIQVESRLASGTTFVVVLPRSPEQSLTPDRLDSITQQ